MNRKQISAAGALALLAGTAFAQLQHGTLNVVENDAGNNTTSVTVTRNANGSGPWVVVDANCNRGDYGVDFGTGSDLTLGILMVGNYQDDRIEPSVNGGASPYYATASTAQGSDGLYFIPVHGSPSGSEVNYNVALAYFPIADGWMAGGAYNSTNGGIITNLVAPASIPLYNLFNDPGIGNGFIDGANGLFGVRLEGIDMARDGVLLVCGAKNEDNFAQVFIDWNGMGVINNHDNGSDGNTAEQDPVAFAFIPDGTSGVTMGRVSGTANKLYSQGDFEVVMVGQPDTNGTWRLTIAGESPSTGTLIVTPTTHFGGNTIDNPVFVTPDGNSWIITSRDITGMGLQDIGSSDVAFHFAFFPADATITPGTTAQDYLDRMGDIGSALFEVTELNSTNENGCCTTQRVAGTDALRIIGDNLGDYCVAYFDTYLAAYLDNGLDNLEGMYLGTPTEFIRDNSATGGNGGWTTLSLDNSNVHLHAATSLGGEINSNFALAYFPASLGFIQDADVGAPAGMLNVAVTGDALTSGVMVANNWDNNNRCVSVTPNGDSYDLTAWEAAGGAAAIDSVEVGYVYLPYTTEGISAGQVDANGSIISGTGDFTVTTTTEPTFGLPVYEISIPGVDSRTDGVLLINASAAGPYAMSYEASATGTFYVAALDCAIEDIASVGFSFAFIPSELTIATCAADLNNDGALNFFDVQAFLGAFASQSDVADWNDDSTFNFFDVQGFLADFAAGCP